VTLLPLLLAALLGGGPAPSPAGDPAAVLHDWDERRAAAWSTGDPAALRPLYVSGAAAGRADAAMLRAWHDRGLRVVGMRMQLLRVVVRHRADARLELVVTDRLVGGVAVGEGLRLPLPRDGVSTRTVVLARRAGEWRVASVHAQPRPERTTSSTVRSRKR
jgi:hypothetical protein